MKRSSKLIQSPEKKSRGLTSSSTSLTATTSALDLKGPESRARFSLGTFYRTQWQIFQKWWHQRLVLVSFLLLVQSWTSPSEVSVGNGILKMTSSWVHSHWWNIQRRPLHCNTTGFSTADEKKRCSTTSQNSHFCRLKMNNPNFYCFRKPIEPPVNQHRYGTPGKYLVFLGAHHGFSISFLSIYWRAKSSPKTGATWCDMVRPHSWHIGTIL